MIHLEPITDELFSHIYIYDGVPQNQPAYDYGLIFQGIGFLRWNPKSGCATIEAFLKKDDVLNKETVLDILERVHDDYDVDVIEWRHGDGRRQRKRRVGSRKWIDF